MQQENKITHLFGAVSLGFLVFAVLFNHLLFLFGYHLSKLILPSAVAIYISIIFLAIYFSKINFQEKKKWLSSLIIFIFFSVLLFLGSKFFAETYDTSWDGQGYHSSGIIELRNGWNPIYQKEMPLKLPDASIIVKGYPKALWILESQIYLATGQLNSGKIMNLVILLIAAAFFWSFLTRLGISKFLKIILTLAIVFQPPAVMEMFSFMADGFSYSVAIIAMSALEMFIFDSQKMDFLSFLGAELLLAGIKYSNLPLVAGLGLIFLFFAYKKTISNELVLKKNQIILLFLSAFIFLLSPYVTNYLYHYHPFYPSNLKEVSASYPADNIPQNIVGKNRVKLLFYGIFSKSQTASIDKSDPRNQAILKIPFTFTKEEIMKAGEVFNNRVGASGPLFSGIISLSALILIILLFQNKKYFLGVFGSVIFLIAITLISPVPNLIRYNFQILFIPFVIAISVLILPKQNRVLKILNGILILAIFLNASIFAYSVLQARADEFAAIDWQLEQMKKTPNSFDVRAERFYSNYVRLEENGIRFQKSDNLTCPTPQILLNSSWTTEFCEK